MNISTSSDNVCVINKAVREKDSKCIMELKTKLENILLKAFPFDFVFYLGKKASFRKHD